MTHAVSILKTDISRYKFEKLQLALSILIEPGIATDTSGDFYEFFVMSNDLALAQNAKYFVLGFLNMPELQ